MHTGQTLENVSSPDPCTDKCILQSHIAQVEYPLSEMLGT